MDQCTACLIVVGDEILRGQIIDTNTSYLARNLTSAGVKLERVTVVPDVVDCIAKEVNNVSKQYTIVFTSGGVGPTHDDVTYEAVAKAFGLKLELHQELFNVYSRLILDKEEIKRFAVVPSSCKIINVSSTSENFPIISVKNVYVLPGSPKYFEPAVNAIIPRLNGCVPLNFQHIDVALNELAIVNILDKQVKRWDGKVKISSYPQSRPQSYTRITLEGTQEAVGKAKEEFLYYLPIEKIMNLESGFGSLQVSAILKNSENEVNVKSAIDILNECYDKYEANEVFLSFNGGKDCTVVLHLVAAITKSRHISSPLCLYVTADSFPEVDVFVESASRYYGLKIIHKPSPMRSALLTLLEENNNLKVALMGTRKSDPGSDNLEPFTFTDPDWPRLMRVNPILNWSYNQVWKFLLKYNVPYCSLYDQGYSSIGNKSNTTRNPLLKDPKNPLSYLPAHTLTNESAEREGRV